MTAAPPRRRPWSPLRHRGFALLWTGALVSDLGDWTLLIGLPVFVFELTGSALTTSTVFVAELIPALVVSQVSGVLVDRFDKRRILVLASVLQAILLLPLLAVNDPAGLWIVYGVAAAQSALARLCSPAQTSLVPALVPPEDLAQANGLTALGGSIARLLGAPLGGIGIALLGLSGVVVVDALTFLAAALLVGLIRPSEAQPATGQVDEPGDAGPTEAPRRGVLRTFAADWTDGIRTIGRSRELLVLVAIGSATQLAQGIFVVLYVVFVIDLLGADGGAVGLIRGMQAIGGIVGGLLVGVVAARLGVRSLVGWGLVLFGSLALLTWNLWVVTTAVPVYVALFAIVGLPAVGVQVGLLTGIQSLSPGTHLGRVLAAYETTSGGLQAVGALAAGSLADRIGLMPILDAQGLIYVLCGIAALALLREPRAAARTPVSNA